MAEPVDEPATPVQVGFVWAALIANAIGPTWLLPDSTPLVAVPFVLIVFPVLLVRRRERRLRRLACVLGILLCVVAVGTIFFGGGVLLPGVLFLLAAATLPSTAPRHRTAEGWIGAVVAAFSAFAGAALLAGMIADVLDT